MYNEIIMIMTRVKRMQQKAFTLPTVLLSSVIMLGLLGMALQLSTATNNALKEQYYYQLAREAAESGARYAIECLRSNGMNATWTGKTLRPETNCSGNIIPGQSTYYMRRGNIQMRFVVQSLSSGGAENQQIDTVGYAELLRPSGGVWKTYSNTSSTRTGAQSVTNMIAFGYEGVTSAPDKVFFATIDSVGKVRTVGHNEYGQLGAGTTSMAQTSPVQYNIPKKAVAAYANFLSIGWNIMVKDEEGGMWGAGWNGYGTLGQGPTPVNVSTPGKFKLPPSVKAVSANVGRAAFVLGDDNNIYAAGMCDKGLLGTGDYSVATSCTHRNVPKRVALPTPNTADPNTIPTSQIVHDSFGAYVLMKGGAVYGWGGSDYFQLGTVNFDATSTPVRIGDFGKPGKPKAVQIVFNGDTLYVVADNGKVYAVGFANRGETGQKNVEFRFYDIGRRCMGGLSSTSLRMTICDASADQSLEFVDGGAIKINGKCVDNAGYDKVSLRLLNCNGTPAQRFRAVYTDNHSHGGLMIELSGTGKCISNYNGNLLRLETCGAGAGRQRIRIMSHRVVELNIPGFVVQASSDQVFASFRNSSGEVYSLGDNTRGVFGNSSNGNKAHNSSPVRFALPAGVKAVDIWATAQSLEVNNLFVVGDNGKVYGAGTNASGQLGDGTGLQRNHATEMNIFGKTPTSPRARSIQGGGETTVIFTTNNKVWTVGANNFGQLGTGDTINHSNPVLGQFTNVPTRDYVTF